VQQKHVARCREITRGTRFSIFLLAGQVRVFYFPEQQGTEGIYLKRVLALFGFML